jgi:hypothetical protein
MESKQILSKSCIPEKIMKNNNIQRKVSEPLARK